jgi:hypothetical protein
MESLRHLIVNVQGAGGYCSNIIPYISNLIPYIEFRYTARVSGAHTLNLNFEELKEDSLPSVQGRCFRALLRLN